MEWGVPVHADRKLFEKIVLEGAQAGLSWITILRKREAYREAFDGFDPEKIARYDAAKIEGLLKNPAIVRNRRKIESAVENARGTLAIIDAYGSLDSFIWRYVDCRPKQNAWKSVSEIPASSAESVALSRDLKKIGFSFVGPTICYALMQAVGLVNDHTTDCYRYSELSMSSL